MKSLALIISSLMITLFSFGQIDTSCIEIGKLTKLPIRDAEVYKCKNPGQGGGYFLLLESSIDSIFSLTDGKVFHISKDPHENDPPDYLVLIRDSSKSYIYMNLINPQFKEGDIVNKGELIGYARKSIKANKRFLILTIINGIIPDSPFLSVTETWQLLKAEDE